VEPDYEQVVALSAQAQSDLNWVMHNIVQRNGKTFGESNIDIVIHSDASLFGWGTVCKGQSANGSWSVTESTNHINYLELLAAFHGLQCFVSTERSVHVRVGIDNSTAVAYLNNKLHFTVCLGPYGSGVFLDPSRLLLNMYPVQPMS
jgi:hypothetical protein